MSSVKLLLSCLRLLLRCSGEQRRVKRSLRERFDLGKLKIEVKVFRDRRCLISRFGSRLCLNLCFNMHSSITFHSAYVAHVSFAITFNRIFMEFDWQYWCRPLKSEIEIGASSINAQTMSSDIRAIYLSNGSRDVLSRGRREIVMFQQKISTF